MKKYNAPEMKALSINVQSTMLVESPEEYVPGIDPNPGEMVKEDFFDENLFE